VQLVSAAQRKSFLSGGTWKSGRKDQALFKSSSWCSGSPKLGERPGGRGVSWQRIADFRALKLNGGRGGGICFPAVPGKESGQGVPKGPEGRFFPVLSGKEEREGGQKWTKEG